MTCFNVNFIAAHTIHMTILKRCVMYLNHYIMVLNFDDECNDLIIVYQHDYIINQHILVKYKTLRNVDLHILKRKTFE